MQQWLVAAEDAILIEYMHTYTHIACSVLSVREEKRKENDIMDVGRSGNWDDLKGEIHERGEDIRHEEA